MGLRLLAEAVNTKKDSPFKVQNTEPLFFEAEKTLNRFFLSMGIGKGGFLIKNAENFYELCFAVGIDITTFHRCIIPAGLLKRLITSLTGWTILTSGNFQTLRNFFSSQEYISITDLYFFPLDGEKCFLFLIKSQKDILRGNLNLDYTNPAFTNLISKYLQYKQIFETAKPVYPLQHGINAVSLKIKSALNAKNFATLMKFSFKELFPDNVKLQNELYPLKLYYSVVNRILQTIGKSNISILRTDQTLYLCIFSVQKLPQDIYIDKIKSLLYSIYGKDFCNKLIIEYMGSSKDINTITEFLHLNKDASGD